MVEMKEEEMLPPASSCLDKRVNTWLCILPACSLTDVAGGFHKVIVQISVLATFSSVPLNINLAPVE